MDSKFRCVFDDSTISSSSNAAAVGAGVNSGGPAGNNRAESDNEDKDLTEAVSSRGGLANDHDYVTTSSAMFSNASTLVSSIASTVMSADSSHFINGVEDDVPRNAYSTAVNTKLVFGFWVL